jgi:OmcA/MtrC family decaheme c-type cytochrome
MAANGSGKDGDRVYQANYSLSPASPTSPTLTASPASIAFTYASGGASPAAQSVAIGSSGSNVNFTAAVSGGSWLAASPASGTTPGAVSVSVNPAGLAVGTYNGALTIASAGAANSPLTLPVSLTVTTTTPPPPPPATAGQFKYNILKIADTKPGQYPKVTFSVTDPANDNAPYELETHPAFTQIASGASRVFIQIGWNTLDFTNTGSRSEFAASGAAAAQPIPINALSAPINNGNGTYTVTSPLPIPGFVQGTAVAAIEGHPAGQDATGAWTVRVPVKSVFKSFIVTGDSRVERRRVVDIKKCKACHGVLSLHGNNRTDEIQVCVMCHNPNATDIPYRLSTDGPETPIDFKVMVHSIHGAQKRTTPYVVIGRAHSVNDFSTVQYPANLRDCRKCHREGTYLLPLKSRLGTTINTQSTLTLTRPIVNGDPVDDTKVTATAAICSSCHDTAAARDHMARNGGSFATLQQFINSGAVREKCQDCHGAGKSKDVAIVHGLK